MNSELDILLKTFKTADCVGITNRRDRGSIFKLYIEEGQFLHSLTVWGLTMAEITNY